MMLLWLTLLSFFSGGLPFSYWIGYLALGKDIRSIADGNPGATNVLRSGGRSSALLALLLDFLKGALPVGTLFFSGRFRGWALVPLAVAPVAGHAFSPFLAWRGGKAVAVTGGVWCGLTAWEGPTVAGLLLAAATAAVGANGWAVLIAQAGVTAYACLAPQRWNRLVVRPPQKILFTIALLQFSILAWKHRADLSTLPRFRTHRHGR